MLAASARQHVCLRCQRKVARTSLRLQPVAVVPRSQSCHFSSFSNTIFTSTTHSRGGLLNAKSIRRNNVSHSHGKSLSNIPTKIPKIPKNWTVEQEQNLLGLAAFQEQMQNACRDKDMSMKFATLLETSGMKDLQDRPDLQPWTTKLEELYAEQSVHQVRSMLGQIIRYKSGRATPRSIKNLESTARHVLAQLGVLTPEPSDATPTEKSGETVETTNDTSQSADVSEPANPSDMPKVPKSAKKAKASHEATSTNSEPSQITDSPKRSDVVKTSKSPKKDTAGDEVTSISSQSPEVSESSNSPIMPKTTESSPEAQVAKVKAAKKAKKASVSAQGKWRKVRSGGRGKTLLNPNGRRDSRARRVGPTKSSARTREADQAMKMSKISVLDRKHLQTANIDNYKFDPIPVEGSAVPSLSFDLSRVLFNPGVYHLQDPRSRVWNFDPYLGKIMPVSEFDYGALNKYITSSHDTLLQELAMKHSLRYTGSTSSLSSALSHFHFLLSGFRELDTRILSRGFTEQTKSFTKITRSPAAIFLRWKNGCYAVDADKEFDSANILMSLGRSMEKLLTLSRDEFEQYRKGNASSSKPKDETQEGEAYHYTELGPFLLRSQLDCYDPRLPGSGIFDLKTRAVAGVRMMLQNHEEGMGYQIKSRYGDWESFEREYFDMMRSAFLKYSLQVRMGRMDGIFVAYHNIERLFGFQYVSLPEMDLALHGQSDKTLGDREFRLSFRLLQDIFDRATEKYPEQSIRFHFESREATKANSPFMYIFAEPVTESDIKNIQEAKKEMIEAYEQRIFNPEKKGGEEAAAMAAADSDSIAFVESIMGVNTVKTDRPDTNADFQGPTGDNSQLPSASETATAEKSTVNDEKPVLAWKLTIRNLVNGSAVPRPQRLLRNDRWDVEYNLVPLDEGGARRNYTLCKNRRRAALEFPQDEDAAAGFYIRRLVELSRQGAQWRRTLDEYDAQRERVVLYQDKGEASQG